jgi:hypothetical protein
MMKNLKKTKFKCSQYAMMSVCSLIKVGELVEKLLRSRIHIHHDIKKLCIWLCSATKMQNEIVIY